MPPPNDGVGILDVEVCLLRASNSPIDIARGAVLKCRLKRETSEGRTSLLPARIR
jgi:hypothetical protein